MLLGLECGGAVIKQLPKLQEMWDGNDMGLTRSKQSPPWEQWFAWYPVKDLNGRKHWLKKIYRRYSWVKSAEQPFGTQ